MLSDLRSREQIASSAPDPATSVFRPDFIISEGIDREPISAPAFISPTPAGAEHVVTRWAAGVVMVDVGERAFVVRGAIRWVKDPD